MAGRIASLRFTANFAANLAEIEAYWSACGFPQGYDRLLDELGDIVIPSLERFPGMGRDFLARQPDSVEAVSRREALEARLAALGGGELREYVLDDYLVLYASVGDVVYLLAVRHHKQMSFAFANLWL